MSSSPYRIRESRYLTVPNLLSVVRVLLLPPSLIALERQGTVGPVPALLMIACALGTDAADGLLARGRGWVSDVGRVLDPLADKIYIVGLILYLALERGFPAWLLGLVLARDAFLVLASALLLRRHNIVFSANRWGKASMVLLSLLVLAYVLEIGEAIPWLQVVAAMGVSFSLFSYVRNGIRFLGGAAVRPA